MYGNAAVGACRSATAAGVQAVDERASPAADQPVLEVPGQASAVEGRVEADPAEDELSDVDELESMAALREEFHRQTAEKVVAGRP